MERETAFILGLKKYASGRPCRHGHNSERYTSSGGCVECYRISTERRREQYRRARAEHQEQIAKSLGLVRLVLYLRPDDVDAVKSYADSLGKDK